MESLPCACGSHGHVLTPETADAMSTYTRLDVDTIYARHGQERVA